MNILPLFKYKYIYIFCNIIVYKFYYDIIAYNNFWYIIVLYAVICYDY